MKRAVNHQMFDLLIEAQSQFARVTFGGFNGNHHISNVTRLIASRRISILMINERKHVCRPINPAIIAVKMINERKHVCRPINPAIIAVKPAHRAVAYERDGQYGFRTANTIERGPRQSGDSTPVNFAQSLTVNDLYLSALLALYLTMGPVGLMRFIRLLVSPPPRRPSRKSPRLSALARG